MRLLLLALLLALPSAAQPLTWEQVGDNALQSDGPPILHASGDLWIGGRAPDTETPSFGVLALPAPYGPQQTWTRPVPYDFDTRGDPIVSFGADTLFTYRSTDVARSVNGGATFEPLPAPADCEDSRMVEVPAGLPHAGRLLCGNRAGDDGAGYVTFSDDRGDSWHEGSGPPIGPIPPTAAHLAIVRAGPRAGRVVAAGQWELATSDDGGATWQPTALWQYFRYDGLGLATLAGAAPGGGDRLLASVNDPATSDPNGLFVSDDGGDTWTQVFSFPDNPNRVSFLDLGDGAALAVMAHGEVRRTEDGGVSWVEVGVVPHSLATGAVGRAQWAWRGPDERLYVGGGSLGPPRPGQTPESYTWRTTEPLAVAGEAAPSAGEALGVAVSPNPASSRIAVGVTLASPSAALRVDVFDSVGRRVAVLHEGAAREALSLDVDTSAFAIGTYRVVVTAEGARMSRAFTVAR